MDRFHTPKRVQSLRHHATYVRHIRRESGKIVHSVAGGKLHSRKASLVSVTEATVRKSILQLMEITREEAIDAAQELAECMDSVFFSKGSEKLPEHHDVHVHGYPAQCITVLPQEGAPKNDGTASCQRRSYSIIDKLNKQLHKRSLTSTQSHKSTSERRPSPSRSKSWTRFSRSLILRRSSASDARRSSSRKSSTVSTTLSHLSDVGSSLKRNLRLADLPDPYPGLSSATSSPTVDEHEVRSYQDVIHPIRQVTPPPPSAFSNDQRRQNIGRSHIDSAYFSDSQRSVNSLSSRSHNVNGNNDGATTAVFGVLATPENGQLSRQTSFEHAFVSPPPPSRYNSNDYMHELHGQPWSPRPKKESRPMRPRLETQRFLTASNIFTEPDLSPKPPSPLRERPFLDMEHDHRRTFSNGSNTLEIKVYMDTELDLAADEQTRYQQCQLGGVSKGSSNFRLFNPLLGEATAVEFPQDDGKNDVAQPTPIFTEASILSREPSYKSKYFPDIPYAPQSNKAGVKWYDFYNTAQSRNPVYMHQSVRGENFDVELARLFERNIPAQAPVAKRLLRARVIMDNGTGREPLDEAMDDARKHRTRSIELIQSITDTLEEMMKDRRTRLGDDEVKSIP